MFMQPFDTPGDALAHYGRKGMKWGVITKKESNGEVKAALPVLSAKKKLRVEKFLKSADIANTQISELKLRNEKLQALPKTQNPVKRYDRYATRTNNKNAIQVFDKEQKRALRDAEAVNNGKLTSKQKKVIVGAVGVSAIIAAGFLYKGQQSGALNSWVLQGRARLRGQKIPFNVNPALRRPMSANELLSRVAKPVNPGYSKAGGKMNCRRSTFAYELRRRGYDVNATTSAAGWGQSESGVINALTPGSDKFYRSMSMSSGVVKDRTSSVARGDTRVNAVKKTLVGGLLNNDPMSGINSDFSTKQVIAALAAKRGQPVSSSKSVLEALAQQPSGARGEVVFKFPTFGHSMAYEVVNGVPHIFDSQKGTLYNAAGKMVESKWDGFDSAEIMRLDNVDLDIDFLTRWATNVGGKK